MSVVKTGRYIGSADWQQASLLFHRAKFNHEARLRIALSLLAAGFAANAVWQLLRIGDFLAAPLAIHNPLGKALSWAYSLGGLVIVLGISASLALLLPWAMRTTIPALMSRARSSYGLLTAGTDELVETLHSVIRHALRCGGLSGNWDQPTAAERITDSPTAGSLAASVTLWLLDHILWLLGLTLGWFFFMAAMYGPRSYPHFETYACADQLGPFMGLQSMLLLLSLLPAGLLRTVALIRLAEELSLEKVDASAADTECPSGRGGA